MAAGSELVKDMTLLMIVSRFPSMVAVTVTVNGEPAIAVVGTENLRTACGVEQFDAIDSPIVAITSRKADDIPLISGQLDLLRNPISKCRYRFRPILILFQKMTPRD